MNLENINLENVTPAQLENYLAVLAAQLGSFYNKSSQAKALFTSLDKFKNEYFATLCKKEEGSQNARERTVLATTAWRKYKRALVKAEKEKLITDIEIKKLENKWETCRSILSSRNAERRTNT